MIIVEWFWSHLTPLFPALGGFVALIIIVGLFAFIVSILRGRTPGLLDMIVGQRKSVTIDEEPLIKEGQERERRRQRDQVLDKVLEQNDRDSEIQARQVALLEKLNENYEEIVEFLKRNEMKVLERFESLEYKIDRKKEH